MAKRTVGPSRVALVHGHSSRIDCKSIAKMALPPGQKLRNAASGPTQHKQCRAARAHWRRVDACDP